MCQISKCKYISLEYNYKIDDRDTEAPTDSETALLIANNNFISCLPIFPFAILASVLELPPEIRSYFATKVSPLQP